jgi:hypothetical protein
MPFPAGDDAAAALEDYVLFYNAIDAMFGQGTLVSDSGRQVRSNAFAMGGFNGLADSALAGSGVACFVPIPVWPGDVITNVNFLVGATPGSTLTHAWCAIYAGSTATGPLALPTVIAQSTDSTAATLAASGWAKFALSSAQTITQAQALYGYIYAAISFTGTVPTAASYSTPTALVTAGAASSFNVNAPIFNSFTAGSALGATAVTVASPSAKATCPLIVLS